MLVSKKREKKILFAEDERSQSKKLSYLLKQLGYDCLPCTNGEEILEVLKAGGEFNLLLCDLQMPEISGLDVLQRLKDQPDLYPRIPVMVLAGITDHTIAEEAIKQGALDVIAKPFNKFTLEQKIRHAIAYNERPTSKKKATVMLVEDDEDVRDTVESLLLREFEVITVESAEKALQEFANNYDQSPIDIVLTDYKMPGNTGLFLANRIKVHYPEVLTILMTGYQDKAIVMPAEPGSGKSTLCAALVHRE